MPPRGAVPARYAASRCARAARSSRARNQARFAQAERPPRSVVSLSYRSPGLSSPPLLARLYGRLLNDALRLEDDPTRPALDEHPKRIAHRVDHRLGAAAMEDGVEPIAIAQVDGPHDLVLAQLHAPDRSAPLHFDAPFASVGTA